MDGVTLRESSETLPELIARLVREAAPAAPGKPAKRVLTPRQELALAESMARREKGWPLGIGQFEGEDICAERLERRHKPWRD